MPKKIQKARHYIQRMREQDKLLSKLAEKDYDLYVLMLISRYEGVSEDHIREMQIKDLAVERTHETVKRVVSNYIKQRSSEEYLIKSKVSQRKPMSDAEYKIRRAIAINN